VPLLPSRRLVVVVAVLALGFLAGPGPALVLDGLLVAALVVDAVGTYVGRRPIVRRTVPARIPLGGSALVRVEIENRGPARRLAWTDDLPVELEREGPDRFEEAVRARGIVRRQYRVRGAERGSTTLGDVHVRLLGPLGLVWRRLRVRRADPTVVQPGLLDLRRHRLLALHHRRRPGVRATRRPEGGREFERLREYVPGDDTRRIDWKATARHGRLIVREYEAERSQSVLLAIDAGRLMSERIAGRDRLDHALAAALVLADAAARQGDAVGVLLFADGVQAYLPPARTSLARIAEILGSVEARIAEPDYPAVFRFLGRRLRRRSLVVLFSDLVDPAVSAPLLANLASAARRHLPLVVAIRNTELEAAADDPATSEEEVYRRAAAEELLQARAVALAAVRRRGVLVADVLPRAAVPETLGRYLEVKARGLL